MKGKKIDVKSVKCNYEILERDDTDRFSRVKVLVAHTGWNYNGTYFSKELLENMANESLGKIPIVGFLEETEYGKDFAGHEEGYKVKVNSEGEEEIELVYFGVPFGFIPPSPEFDFEMVDTELGELEYLVTYGYVWNKFEGSELFDEQKSHSMELLPETLDGNWVDRGNNQGGWEITNATFDALCALGDNHSPAMAGSMIEKFSHKFTKKHSFKEQFQEMYDEYERVEDEGGEQMEKEERKELLLNKVNSLGTFENELGDTVPKYSLVDIDEDVVILKSFEDWNDYGVEFTIDPETKEVDMDIEKAFEAIAKYSPKSEALEEGESKFESKVGEDFDRILNAKHNTLTTEKDELWKKYEKKLEDEKTAITKDFEDEKEKYEKTISELTKFKDNQVSKDKASFIRKVENLTEDEKQNFLDERNDYSMDELVNKVKLFVADKVMTYSKKEDEVEISAISTINNKDFSKKETTNDDDFIKWLEDEEE